MNNKAIEKLFKLAYTDMMTGAKNRNAFDETIERMRHDERKLEKVCVLSIVLTDYDILCGCYGNRTGDEAIRELANCILDELGEKADVYRTGTNEFICIANKNLFPYVANLGEVMFKISEEKEYPFFPVITCVSYNEKKHKTIDELLLYCDKKANALRKHKPF